MWRARPEDEVFWDMVELVGGEMAERIASLVWGIAFGEGYTLDEWIDLLESLKILSPWGCIWRFQELVFWEQASTRPLGSTFFIP